MELKLEMLTDEQINEMWMRRVQTSPADFLRSKFAFQQYDKEDQKEKKTEKQEQ